MDVRIEQSWKEALSPQFDAPYFEALADFTRRAYATGTVYPPGREIFAAFDACPFNEVKVVILGQDPYHGPGQANGLCFSVSPGVKIPPSLQNIFKEVHDDTGAPIPDNGDLTRWATQGVLLLNNTLTVEAHRAGSHQGHGWETFTDAAVKALSDNRTGLVFMLWGSPAIRKGAVIDRSKHLVLTSPHPSPLSAYRGFFGNHHFSQANAFLVRQGKTPIQW
ncbi:MAG: uracil-DNA glycosylase [Muribaculaceae bacterium]|nr:uracil-DNA glycosylase [Muribaculaceae bacterium]